MSGLNIQNSRLQQKYSTISGSTPSIAPSTDHTDGSWGENDIYVGEVYINVQDDTMFFRSLNGIIPITSGTTTINTSAFLNLTGGTLTGTLYAPTISATTISASTIYSPSFNGTFVGDGSGLTGITSTSVFSGGTVSGATIFTSDVDLCNANVTINEINNCGGHIDIYSDINVVGAVSATTFEGDGSLITNLPYVSGLTLDQVLTLGDTSASNDIQLTNGNITLTNGTYFGDGSGLTGIPPSPIPTLDEVLVSGDTSTNGNIYLTNGDIVLGNGIYYGDGSGLTNLIATTDIFVTGGTYSSGTAIFTNNSGGTFNVTGFSTGGGTYWTGGSAGVYSVIALNDSGLDATGDYSYAEGSGTTANGAMSHAEGELTVSDGISSHAEGYGSNSTGIGSHAEGFNTIAFGDYSHAEGEITNAQGNGSHAEGYGSQANGGYSHAEGYVTSSDGAYSHSEGFQTHAGGTASHSEGYGSESAGHNSHSGGWYTFANGLNSFVHGSGSTASGINTIVLGSGITGITDNTTYVNSLIGTTISATTYQNLPINTDVFVTGGTYNNGTGIATFTNNTGSTFNVTGFTTGFTETQNLTNVLALGNTTGANDIVVEDGQKIESVSGNTSIEFVSDTELNIVSTGDVYISGGTSVEIEYYGSPNITSYLLLNNTETTLHMDDNGVDISNLTLTPTSLTINVIDSGTTQYEHTIVPTGSTITSTDLITSGYTSVYQDSLLIQRKIDDVPNQLLNQDSLTPSSHNRHIHYYATGGTQSIFFQTISDFDLHVTETGVGTESQLAFDTTSFTIDVNDSSNTNHTGRLSDSTDSTITDLGIGNYTSVFQDTININNTLSGYNHTNEIVSVSSGSTREINDLVSGSTSTNTQNINQNLVDNINFTLDRHNTLGINGVEIISQVEEMSTTDYSIIRQYKDEIDLYINDTNHRLSNIKKSDNYYTKVQSLIDVQYSNLNQAKSGFTFDVIDSGYTYNSNITSSLTNTTISGVTSGNITGINHTSDSITSTANDVASTITDTITLDPQGSINNTGIKSEDTTTTDYTQTTHTPTSVILNNYSTTNDRDLHINIGNNNIVTNVTETSTGNYSGLEQRFDKREYFNIVDDGLGNAFRIEIREQPDDVYVFKFQDDNTGDYYYRQTNSIASYEQMVSDTTDIVDTISLDPTGVSLGTGIKSINNTTTDYSQTTHTPTNILSTITDNGFGYFSSKEIKPQQHQTQFSRQANIFTIEDKRAGWMQTADDTAALMIYCDVDPAVMSSGATIVQIKAHVRGISSDKVIGYAAEIISWVRVNPADIGDPVVQIGTVDYTIKSEFTTAHSSFVISGPNMYIDVTGEIGITIDWTCNVELLYDKNTF